MSSADKPEPTSAQQPAADGAAAPPQAPEATEITLSYAGPSAGSGPASLSGATVGSTELFMCVW